MTWFSKSNGRAVAALAVMAAAFVSGAVQAQTALEERLVFVGADPDEGLPGPVTGPLGILAFDALPTEATVADEVLSSLLRATPVSTFASGSGDPTARTGGLHLVVDLALSQTGDAIMAQVGGEALALDALESRLTALTGALHPATRKIAYLRIDDPDDIFPTALSRLRSSAATLSFDALVVTVDREPGCEGGRAPHHYEVLAGIPDRVPFGDGDGLVTRSEATVYLEDALARAASRGMPCAANYSLIFAPEEAGTDEAIVAQVDGTPLIPALDQAVYLEGFAALFLLSSEDGAAIDSFLASCAYCPSERGLQTQLQAINLRVRLTALEEEVWSSIQNDEQPDRIEVYLENCQICTFEQDARTRIEVLTVAAQVRAAEQAEMAALMASDDLDGLLRWLVNCVACEGREAVEERIATLEADGRYAEEAETLETAIRLRNTDGIARWLETCVLCAPRDEAEATLAAIESETAAAAPCVAAAGLPQLGGPRTLSDIDVEEAAQICDEVLTSYPDSALAATIRGRVALAEGDAEAAQAGYAVGMDAGLPQAFGLAAHNAYAPLDEAEPDYTLADTFAQRGYEAGDWYSGEVLVVLYSRELVPGRTASDAFDIALAHAEVGNPVAQFFAGFFLNTGTGTAPDPVEAVRWFEASVAQGYAHAGPFLAAMLEAGVEGEEGEVVVAADPARAAIIYLDAIAAGDPTALVRLTDEMRDRPRDLVREVQALLSEAGTYSSTIDGIGGRGTIRAVTEYAELFNGDDA